MGEGWHNYHHAFPWDYRASEYGAKFNYTTYIIDLLAYFGLVWDCREAPEHFIEYRVKNFGDGSHETYGINVDECDKKKTREIVEGKFLENKTKIRAFK